MQHYFTIQHIFILFMGYIVFFDTIYESHYTISVNFYIYLKVFSFN